MNHQLIFTQEGQDMHLSCWMLPWQSLSIRATSSLISSASFGKIKLKLCFEVALCAWQRGELVTEAGKALAGLWECWVQPHRYGETSNVAPTSAIAQVTEKAKKVGLKWKLNSSGSP